MTTTSVPPATTSDGPTPTDSTDLPRGTRRSPDAGAPASALDTAHAQLAGAQSDNSKAFAGASCVA